MREKKYWLSLNKKIDDGYLNLYKWKAMDNDDHVVLYINYNPNNDVHVNLLLFCMYNKILKSNLVLLLSLSLI